jgi:hypothetical protein
MRAIFEAVYLAVLMAFFVAWGFLAYVQYVHPAPARYEGPPQPEPVETYIELKCSYGLMTVTGDRVELRGIFYTATGNMRKDGSLFLVWTAKGSNMVYLGVYRWVDGGLAGNYGYAQETGLDENGELWGALTGEKIIKAE